jgi:ECF transporter S component (folate family)
MDTKSLTSMAMLVTLAYVVVLISKQIPIRVAGFLDMDFSDVVVIIGGFMFGPLSAAAISGVVAFIELMTISDTGVYGYIMNVVSTCSFVCVSAAFYKKNRNMRSAVIGLIAGCISVTAVMMLWNYIVTPIYLEIPRQAVAPMLVPVFLPYNLLKSGINAALAVLLYKPLVVGLRRAKLVPESSDSSQGKINLGAMLAAAFILVSLILLFLVLAGVL